MGFDGFYRVFNGFLWFFVGFFVGFLKIHEWCVFEKSVFCGGKIDLILK